MHKDIEQQLSQFMDVERLGKFFKDNKELIKNPDFPTENDWKKFSKSTTSEWRRFQTLPSEAQLNSINETLEKTKIFKYINIADMLLCANNAKDKSTVSDKLEPTGKKVLNILLMGRIYDGTSKSGIFYVSKNESDPLWIYLKNKCGNLNGFYYYPGRTVSLKQIYDLSKQYKNEIASIDGVELGVEYLVNAGLAIWTDKDNGLCKLDFDGCEKFLIKNKKEA